MHVSLKHKTHVLFDLDHSLVDAVGRDHMIPAAMESGQWDEYHYAGANDPPAHDGIKLYRLFRESGFTCIGVTARPAKFRELTEDWLATYGISFDALLMREDECFRSSPDMKLKLANDYFSGKIAEKVLFIVDDREDVAKAFAAAGVSSLQIWGRKYG